MSSIIGMKFNSEVIKHYQSRTVIHRDVIAIFNAVSTKALLALVSWYPWERWKRATDVMIEDWFVLMTSECWPCLTQLPITGLFYSYCVKMQKRSTMHMTQNVQKKFYTQHNTNNAWHCVECEYFLLSIFASLGKCCVTLNDLVHTNCLNAILQEQ